MFSSACSLRSSTCATLIALAAAAGISRFEPAAAKPLASLPAIVRLLAAAVKSPQAPAYPISIAACADAAPMAQMTITASAAETLASLAAETPATGWSSAPRAIETEISFFDGVGAVPTARDHSHPFAVGPPRRGNDTSLRAAGHAWPGDSSARRSQVSRIARVSISFSPAPLMRGPASGPRLAESLSSPSCVRRVRCVTDESGEPGNAPRSSRLSLAAARRARTGRFPGSDRFQPPTCLLS